jgi:hypothetical protein
MVFLNGTDERTTYNSSLGDVIGGMKIGVYYYNALYNENNT